jgi:hypothetical protein
MVNRKVCTYSMSEPILPEAHQLINNDRNESYDHPLDNFYRIKQGWEVIFGFKVTEEQVGLAMAWVKIAREAYKHKRDNLVDGAGYLGTVDMVITERERRANKDI